jgi:hypothetical protein
LIALPITSDDHRAWPATTDAAGLRRGGVGPAATLAPGCGRGAQEVAASQIAGDVGLTIGHAVVYGVAEGQLSQQFGSVSVEAATNIPSPSASCSVTRVWSQYAGTLSSVQPHGAGGVLSIATHSFGGALFV